MKSSCELSGAYLTFPLPWSFLHLIWFKGHQIILKRISSNLVIVLILAKSQVWFSRRWYLTFPERYSQGSCCAPCVLRRMGRKPWHIMHLRPSCAMRELRYSLQSGGLLETKVGLMTGSPGEDLANSCLSPGRSTFLPSTLKCSPSSFCLATHSTSESLFSVLFHWFEKYLSFLREENLVCFGHWSILNTDGAQESQGSASIC